MKEEREWEGGKRRELNARKMKFYTIMTSHITQHITLRHSPIQVQGVRASYLCGVKRRGGIVTFKSATTKYSGAPQNIVRSSQESLSKSIAATDPDWG
jgi:hypothetical protein